MTPAEMPPMPAPTTTTFGVPFGPNRSVLVRFPTMRASPRLLVGWCELPEQAARLAERQVEVGPDAGRRGHDLGDHVDGAERGPHPTRVPDVAAHVGVERLEREAGGLVADELDDVPVAAAVLELRRDVVVHAGVRLEHQLGLAVDDRRPHVLHARDGALRNEARL